MTSPLFTTGGNFAFHRGSKKLHRDNFSIRVLFLANVGEQFHHVEPFVGAALQYHVVEVEAVNVGVVFMGVRQK